MRNFHRLAVLVVVSLLALVSGCSHSHDASGAADTINVMTYNIHHGEGTDRKLDLARIARFITENHVDLAAIQEVDVKTARVGLDTPAELARLTGLHAKFVKAIDFQGGAYGQVILSRYDISEPRRIALPSKPEKEQRIAMAVDIRPGHGRSSFRFVSVHLDHQSEDDRVVQATRLMRELGTTPATILCGDFNARPASRTMAIVFEKYDDSARGRELGPTGPADRPTLKIDYILTSKNAPWKVAESRVIDDRIASDHRPVLTRFSW